MCVNVQDEAAMSNDVFSLLRCECIILDAATMDDQEVRWENDVE